MKEFKLDGLSDVVRSVVGSTIIILATLLVTGIWYPSLVLFPAIIMAFLMLSAQYFHFKANNPWNKHLPSLFLLALCVYIAIESLKIN